MSFGKRGDETGAPFGGVRPVLVAPSAKPAFNFNLDKGFIALALGVIVLSAGGAIAAPSLFSWVAGSFSGGPARPIGTVVAGLTQDQVKAALAREAFPDQEGRAFMASLAANFPEDHDRLLNDLANKALQGGNREDLMLAVGRWLADFAPRNLPAIGRTGAEGFDQALAIASDGLDLLQMAGKGRCNVESLQRLANNPGDAANLGAYGSPGYKIAMRASRVMVDLAAGGRNARPAETTLKPEDEQALQSAFFGMMSDPQVMSLMQMQSASSRQAVSSAAISQIDVCKLGHVVVVKLKNLPSGAKSRLWGMALQQARIQL